MRSTRPPAAALLAALTALTAFAALPAAAAAQGAKGEKLPKWRIDPYTKNQPEAMQKAGYVSFGPFRFGNLADAPVESSTIDDAYDHVQILWLETAHFRFGCNLPAWPVPLDPETRGKIRGELETLGAKLPGVNPKIRTLDPWLRAHLFAQRLEAIYTEFQQLAGVKDEEFPADQSKVIRMPGARFMGYGPFLGMRDKFLVLLFEKESSFRVYMKKFLGRESRFGQRWHFKESGSLLYTIATECDEGRHKHDTCLHCNIAFNVGQNLLDGFRGYGYDLPAWIREGFGHWMERRVDPHWNSFDQNEGSTADMKTTWRWEPYCRALVSGTGKYAPFAEAYAWRDFGDIKFNDHVAIWSRMDWLMTQGQAKWAEFLFAVKGRVDENWMSDQSDLVGAVRDALQKAYGVSVLDFDRRWIEWVKATYPAQ